MLQSGGRQSKDQFGIALVQLLDVEGNDRGASSWAQSGKARESSAVNADGCKRVMLRLGVWLLGPDG
jgi:hypothetical protein